MVYFPVLCHVYLCLEFWHNERSFAKCVQATGKNCIIYYCFSHNSHEDILYSITGLGPDLTEMLTGK